MHAKINNKGKPNIMLQGINLLSAGVRVDSYSPHGALCNCEGVFYEDMKQLQEWGFWLVFTGFSVSVFNLVSSPLNDLTLLSFSVRIL